jgi:glycogen(starch) synthase
MRIMFWSDSFWPYIGGAAVMAANLLPALRQLGHELVVVTSHGDMSLRDQERHKGISVHRFPFRQAMGPGDVDRLAEIRQQLADLKQGFGPDLVHMNSIGPSVFFHLSTVKAHRASFLLTLDRFLAPDAAGADTLQGRALRSADWIACCSEAVLARLRRRAPQVIERTSVVHWGLGPPPMSPLPLSADPPKLLCLGPLIREKGFDLALWAFSLVLRRFPNARMVVAGDGPARPALEEQASSLGIGQAVEFPGWVAPYDVPALVNTATMVLVPSRREEPFSMAALEAARMERPVVAAHLGALPEIVAHQRTGLIFPRENVSALAEAIMSLLTHPETAAAMGETAKQRLRQDFSVLRCANAYDRLYNEIVRRVPHLKLK